MEQMWEQLRADGTLFGMGILLLGLLIVVLGCAWAGGDRRDE